MPSYVYEVRDLFTHAVVNELELYGVYCTRMISDSGQFQGSYVLQDGKTLKNRDLLAHTAPGRYGLTMKRDGEDIWGGIIWSRVYAAQGQTMQIFANTWESYFEHMVFWKDHFIQQKVAQETIFSAIVSQLQGQSAAANIGLTIVSSPTTNLKRTVLIPNYEYHFGSEAISQIVGVDLGLEYTISPNKQITVAAEGQLGEHIANPSMSYDFPGAIRNYWMPESGAGGAVKLASLGAGSGNKILRSVTVDENAIAAGYPEWWKVTQYSDIADISTLQGKNVADFNKYKMPYLTPTFDMRPDANFNKFNSIGSDFDVTIQDIRYPEGKTFRSRMLGWELTPEGANSDELLKIAIDGSGIAA